MFYTFTVCFKYVRLINCFVQIRLNDDDDDDTSMLQLRKLSTQRTGPSGGRNSGDLIPMSVFEHSNANNQNDNLNTDLNLIANMTDKFHRLREDQQSTSQQQQQQPTQQSQQQQPQQPQTSQIAPAQATQTNQNPNQNLLNLQFDDAINNQINMEWINKPPVQNFIRTCALCSFISICANTPETFKSYKLLMFSTYAIDLLCTLVFSVEMIAKIKIRGLFRGDNAYMFDKWCQFDCVMMIFHVVSVVLQV